MEKKKRIVVLVSGNGTNLQAIIDGCAPDGVIENAEVAAVVSNTAEAYALERAVKHQIPTAVIRRKDHADQTQFDEQLTQIITIYQPDLIVSAGFLVKIPTMLLEKFPGKIINIHPSLIPAFCGKGMYGLKVHEAVLKKHAMVTGATVHFVDADLDTGPIIVQVPVPVYNLDTPGELQIRVMQYAEWGILPWAINHLVNERIRLLNDGEVWYSPQISLRDGVSGWVKGLEPYPISEY